MRVSALVRGTIDLLLMILFAVLAVTGIGLYLAPSGRIAETINWTFMGLDKDTLTLVHTYIGFVTIGLIVIHVIIGFNSMWVMLKSAFRKSKLKSAAALIIPLLLIAGGYQVFAQYTGETEDSGDIYDAVSYETSTDNSTVYITGTMMKYYTVQQLADTYNVSAESLVEVLKKDYGIDATPEETLAEIEYKYDLDREEFKAMLEEAILKLREEGS